MTHEFSYPKVSEVRRGGAAAGEPAAGPAFGGERRDVAPSSGAPQAAAGGETRTSR